VFVCPFICVNVCVHVLLFEHERGKRRKIESAGEKESARVRVCMCTCV